MKITMNLTTYDDDLARFESQLDLRSFLDEHGLDGIELMDLAPSSRSIVDRSMVLGVHLPYYITWLDMWRGNDAGLIREFGSLDAAWEHYGGTDRSCIVNRFKDALAIAHRWDAEYVVFHVSESGVRENFTFEYAHHDEEVIDAACEILNEVFAEEDGSIALLLENLWQPGLTLLRPRMTKRLMDGVAYENKGIMFDTGHLLHTNLDLQTQDEAVRYVHRCLDAQGDLCAFMRGVHFQQSLTGEYCKQVIANPPDLSASYEELFGQGFMHAFSVDRHEPWTIPAACTILDRLPLEYCTLEYITSSREQHSSYLKAAQIALPQQRARA